MISTQFSTTCRSPLSRLCLTAAGCSLLLALVATVAALPVGPIVQGQSVSAGLSGPPIVDPVPWYRNDPELPVVTVSGQGRFDEDTSSASYGNWGAKSGKFAGVKYNRTRTKTVIDVHIFDQYVRIGPGSGGAPAVYFYGTDPYSYSSPFTPDPGTGVMTGMLSVYADESWTTTKTEFTEYWYKSGNNWTYVGTGSGTVVSSESRGTGVGFPLPYSYEVVDGAR